MVCATQKCQAAAGGSGCACDRATGASAALTWGAVSCGLAGAGASKGDPGVLGVPQGVGLVGRTFLVFGMLYHAVLLPYSSATARGLTIVSSLK